MSRELIEVIVLGVIAGFIVARLYATFGRRTGSERPAHAPSAPMRTQAPAETRVDVSAQPVGGMGELMRADPGFDPAQFLSGARKAYEMIVQAYAKADRETLQGLLTPRVYAAYDKALEAADGERPELVRLRAAELLDGSIAQSIAKIVVRFEAELAQGAVGIRETQEKWTFERDLSARDRIWRLSAVSQA